MDVMAVPRVPTERTGGRLSRFYNILFGFHFNTRE